MKFHHDKNAEIRDEISEAIMHNNIVKLKEFFQTHKSFFFDGANFSLKYFLFSNVRDESNSNSSPQLNSTTYHQLSKLILPTDYLTAMHIAAFTDSLESFVILEKSGLDINALSANNYLPFHYALVNGSLEVASYIISQTKNQIFTKISMPSVFIQFFFFYTIPILYLAVLSNNEKIVSLLFKQGFKYNPKAYNQYNPFKRCIQNKSINILKILLKYSTTGISTTLGDTWIMKSIRINQPETIPILLEAGDDVNKIIQNSNGEYESALSLSCKSYIKNKEELVRFIVEKASILDIDEKIQASGAVHWICESKSPIICKMVIEKGINNVNRFDKYGLSGPSRMTENENNENDVIEIISILVSHGFNLNGIAKIQSAQPLIANFCQAIRISYNVIEWLLKNGADPHLKFNDNKGNLRSTLDIVQNKKNSKLKEIFAKYAC